MGKKGSFHGLSKWLVLFGLLLALAVGNRQAKAQGELTLLQWGTKAVKEGFVRQMLSSASLLWGFMLEDEWSADSLPTIKTESRMELSKEKHFTVSEEMEANIRKENTDTKEETGEEFLLTEGSGFVPQIKKQQEYDMKEFETLEELVKKFYTVDPTTAVEASFLNVENLSSYDCSVDKNAPGPQILIYHTHSQESFANSEEGKDEDTILGAGEILASYLEDYGFQVYHHKGKYDVESRDYAYSKALPEMEKLLQENPTIQVVIDLHRDAVADTTRLVTDIQGKSVAKVMFFNGLGRTKKQGEIEYLKNPYLKENLAFSFQMKAACDEYYPGFARSIYLRAYRYNMHLCPKTLLIELGAQTNTKEEIFAALEPLAHVLSMVMQKK